MPNFNGGHFAQINLFERRFEEKFGEIFQNFIIDDHVVNFSEFASELINSHQDEDVTFALERSLFCNMRIFVRSMLDDKKIDDLGAGLLLQKGDRFFSMINNIFNICPIFVHLHDEPEHIYERLQRRNREGEEIVGFEYICELEKRYETMFQDNFPFPIVKLNLADYVIKDSHPRQIDIDAIATVIKSFL